MNDRINDIVKEIKDLQDKIMELMIRCEVWSEVIRILVDK